MEWNLFIVPLTGIFVQLLKTLSVDRKWMPLIAVIFGGLLGGVFAASYQADAVMHVVQGVMYGASAAGIYDVVASTKATNDK